MIELVIFISANVDVRVNQWQHFLKVSAAETQNEIPDENFKGTRNSKAVIKNCLQEKQSFAHVFQNRCS